MRRIPLPVAELVDLYVRQEWPIRAIAEKYGVSYSTAHSHLRGAGVQLRARGAECHTSWKATR